MIFRLACVIFGILALNAVASNDGVLAALETRDYRALESLFAGVESSFAKKQISERQLLEAYRPFYQSQDSLSTALNEWVQQNPSSYYARLARGTYLRKIGEFRRGRQFTSMTPAEDLAYMRKVHAQAREDLDAALLLRPGSYLPALNLLNIAQFSGDANAARRYFNLANRAYPENLLARARYLVSLKPRWGGSDMLMQSFIAENARSGASKRQIKLLQAIHYDDLGANSVDNGDNEKARSYFVKAMELSRDADDGFRTTYLDYMSWFCLGADPIDPTACRNR